MGSRNFPLENAAAERSGLSPHFALRAKWWPEVESNHRHGDFQYDADNACSVKSTVYVISIHAVCTTEHNKAQPIPANPHKS